MGPGLGGAAPSPQSAGAAAAPEVLPDIRRPDYQLMMQDLAQSRREVFEARRDGDKRVSEERERSRWEMDRMRTEMSDRLKKADRENDALINALGRLREENDRLREEAAVLKITRSNGHTEPKPEPKDEAASHRLGQMGRPPSSFLKKTEVTVIPTTDPLLGPVPIDPTKMV